MAPAVYPLSLVLICSEQHLTPWSTYVAGKVWAAKCQGMSSTHAVYSVPLLLIGPVTCADPPVYVQLIGLHVCREKGPTYTEDLWKLSSLPAAAS